MTRSMQLYVVSLAILLLLASSVLVYSLDGRSFRRAPTTKNSMRHCQWLLAKQNPQLFDGWFRDMLRCKSGNFFKLVELIELHWFEVHPPFGKNTHFMIVDRVAVTLHYLAHSSSFIQSKNIFGMGKASAVRYVGQVIAVIMEKLITLTIRFPTCNAEWEEIAKGFEDVCGFPNVAGAIDGSIIEIQRPGDFEGWYCRKGYPAINLQGVCDFKKRFIAYSLRPGSCSDKLVFLMSDFGRAAHKNIPRGYHWLADAGYRLTPQVITPFDLYEEMPRDQRTFNYLHSKTRIAIECAFGILKERFRILKVPLGFSPTRCSEIIVSCMVLHNILLDLNDDAVVYRCPENADDQDNAEADEEQDAIVDAAALQHGREKRITIMNYLCQ